nr:MAG TPA: hypothetical protein [Caudoviricetes sp.]
MMTLKNRIPFEIMLFMKNAKRCGRSKQDG